jgi:hypothetical protein
MNEEEKQKRVMVEKRHYNVKPDRQVNNEEETTSS